MLPGLQQIRCGEILQRNVNARRKRARGRRFARHLPQRARDGEFRIADLDRVAHLGMELKEQAFVDEARPPWRKSAPPLAERFPSRRKREIAAERADGSEPGRIAPRKNGHGREAVATLLGSVGRHTQATIREGNAMLSFESNKGVRVLRRPDAARFPPRRRPRRRRRRPVAGRPDPPAARGRRRPIGDINCILLFLVGGPSQLDTWDLKPARPDNVRGPFRPIQTNVPGIEICEHFPLMAQMADRYAIVRSVHHQAAPIHETGHQMMQTGHLFRGGQEYPHYGSVVSHLRGREPSGLPPFVVAARPDRQHRRQRQPRPGGRLPRRRARAVLPARRPGRTASASPTSARPTASTRPGCRAARRCSTPSTTPSAPSTPPRRAARATTPTSRRSA